MYLDAQEALSTFISARQPDWDRFEAAIGSVISGIRPQKGQSGLRAYGEMVSLLWKAGQFAAAIRLEQFWNKFLARWSFSLYCSYSIDIFDKTLYVGALDGVLCNHSHLLPSESQGNLETAVNLAMDEVLGTMAKGLRVQIDENQPPSWAVIPEGEASILWLRTNRSQQGEHIVARAREHYQRLVQQSELTAVSQ